MAELALGIIGAVDGCVKITTFIFAKYRGHRDADKLLNERFVLLEAIWTKVETQLFFLQKISEHLTEELAESLLKLLQILYGKLVEALSRIEPPTTEDGSFRYKAADFLRKFKFSMLKTSLDELIAELESWQNRFDPTWYLIILISNSALDNALRESKGNSAGQLNQGPDPLSNMLALRSNLMLRPSSSGIEPQPAASVNLPLQGFEGAMDTAIPFSTARTIFRQGTSNLLIGEAVPCPPGTLPSVKLDIENLARRLQQAEPDTFGLLRCYGLLKYKDRNSGGLAAIDFIYRTPTDSAPPASLREHLLEQNPVSISAILKIAKQLVRSVSYIHACNFVHKNIQPENILVFPDSGSRLGSSFLVGFNQFRNINFQTSMLGDPAWHRNLYRHPQRQGMHVQNRYMMQHDIYSIGVCLLEIGLWRCFVWYPDLNPNSHPVAGIQLGLDICDAHFHADGQAVPTVIKDHLVTLTKRELPPRMGDLYTEVVLTCLTCLDPGNETFGVEYELRDKDGIVVGVRFVEGILSRLCEISV
ncbi:hypothetical protein ABW19_dt0208206 [Dactylella cylindrospora]|nr:hypothetical protein ABW19_dt0208206 [Dactylella cylindrospora]